MAPLKAVENLEVRKAMPDTEDEREGISNLKQVRPTMNKKKVLWTKKKIK
jgi:hypothetical protein